MSCIGYTYPGPASPFTLSPSDLITLQGWMRGVADFKTAIPEFIEAYNEHSAKSFKCNKTAKSIISPVHKAMLRAIRNMLIA